MMQSKMTSSRQQVEEVLTIGNAIEALLDDAKNGRAP
jgi:hypothetical protein